MQATERMITTSLTLDSLSRAGFGLVPAILVDRRPTGDEEVGSCPRDTGGHGTVDGPGYMESPVGARAVPGSTFPSTSDRQARTQGSGLLAGPVPGSPRDGE